MGGASELSLAAVALSGRGSRCKEPPSRRPGEDGLATWNHSSRAGVPGLAVCLVCLMCLMCLVWACCSMARAVATVRVDVLRQHD